MWCSVTLSLLHSFRSQLPERAGLPIVAASFSGTVFKHAPLYINASSSLSQSLALPTLRNLALLRQCTHRTASVVLLLSCWTLLCSDSPNAPLSAARTARASRRAHCLRKLFVAALTEQATRQTCAWPEAERVYSTASRSAVMVCTGWAKHCMQLVM